MHGCHLFDFSIEEGKTDIRKSAQDNSNLVLLHNDKSCYFGPSSNVYIF